MLTTAPTERQVKEIIWREIRHRHSTASVELPGKPLTMKLDMGPIDFMLGFSTNNIQQIQGFHSPNILVIIDEANGFPIELYDPIRSLLSGGERAILFQIGNPIEPAGPFFESFSDGHTATHTISCLNHPNVVSGLNVIPGAVTKAWVDEQARLWGTDSAFWMSRVLGKFPSMATDIVISLMWVEQAEQTAWSRKLTKTKPRFRLGFDAAEYGSDNNTWFVGDERGCRDIVVKRNIEQEEGEGTTKYLMHKYEIKPEDVSIDAIGIGSGIASNFRRDNLMINAFKGSRSAMDDGTYANAITEAWFNIRHLLNPVSSKYCGYSFGGAKHDRLKSDLCTRKYKTNEKGQLKLEAKETYRKRMKRSPDFGDAMALCYSYMGARPAYGILTLPNVIGDY